MNESIRDASRDRGGKFSSKLTGKARSHIVVVISEGILYDVHKPLEKDGEPVHNAKLFEKKIQSRFPEPCQNLGLQENLIASAV